MKEKLEYTIKTSTRSRGIRIAVHLDGEVIVTTPRFVPKFVVRAFVEKHRTWIEKHTTRAQSRTSVHVSRKDVVSLKQAAKTYLEKECALIAKKYGFEYKKITVRAQKSRWGSCSKSGNLNFNYKIMALPSHVAQYIVVHEVCHLGELNHSKSFWNLVRKEVPDYLKVRKELRQIQIIIK